MVEALNAYNLDDVHNNVVDEDQSDIEFISGSYVDGKATCWYNCFTQCNYSQARGNEYSAALLKAACRF